LGKLPCVPRKGFKNYLGTWSGDVKKKKTGNLPGVRKETNISILSHKRTLPPFQTKKETKDRERREKKKKWTEEWRKGFPLSSKIGLRAFYQKSSGRVQQHKKKRERR